MTCLHAFSRAWCRYVAWSDYLEFWLVHCSLRVCYDWSQYLLWFWFLTTPDWKLVWWKALTIIIAVFGWMQSLNDCRKLQLFAWVLFYSLCDWLEKLTPLCQSIRRNTITKRWRHSNWSVVITMRLSCASDEFDESIGILRGFKVENILDSSRFLRVWSP